jgi:hypothetical protein
MKYKLFGTTFVINQQTTIIILLLILVLQGFEVL